MSPNRFAWHMPVTVQFGVDCTEAMGELLAQRSVVVLAFEPARMQGLPQRWQQQLGDRLVQWVDVPDGLSTLARARELSRLIWPLLQKHPDAVLLAVGGGTTMDLAKVLRCRPVDGDFEGVAAALRGQSPWPELTLSPLWLVPTTAGTGSEVTRWATVWDTDQSPPVKRSFDEPFGYADLAWVDPRLSLSCPLHVARDCALDALSHALEAMWNHHANEVSNSLALRAAKRVLIQLPLALAQPEELSARVELSLAALEAGLAFSQTRTALAHALSYSVTLEQGLPHGLAVALWLPTTWRLALGHNDQLDRLLNELFPGQDGALALMLWLASVGVDARPSAHGIADADDRVSAALGSARGRNFIATKS